MSRTSENYYEDDRLIAGYDYKVQAWVMNGVYVDCGHPQPGERFLNAMTEQSEIAKPCDCYGRANAGQPTLMGQDHRDGHQVMVGAR